MKRLMSVLAVASLGFLLAGCGNSAYELSSSEKAAFNDAPVEVRQLWEDGLKAYKADDYLTASTKLRALLGKPVTPEQLAAVQTTLAGLNARVHEEAAKGSDSAKKALEAMTAEGPKRRE